MNKSILIGRLTKDVDIRYTTGESQMAVARLTLAVDRRGRDSGTDFIQCVAFGRRAETLERYVKKGHRLAVCGHIRTGSYDKDGCRVYTTDIVIDDFDFLERAERTDDWQ